MKDNPLKTGVEGDAALRLPCTVTGYPKPSIIWTVDGFEIKSDGKYLLRVKYPKEENKQVFMKWLFWEVEGTKIDMVASDYDSCKLLVTLIKYYILQYRK